MPHCEEYLDSAPRPKTNIFTKIILIALIVLVIIILISLFAASSNASQVVNVVSRTYLNLLTRFRQVWHEHVHWTREVVTAISDGVSSNISATTNRLLRNVPDMVSIFSQYYPPHLVDPLTPLLTEHLTVAAELVSAVKRNDTAAIESNNTRWYANADQLSTHFARMNPVFWPKNEMKAMWNRHLDLLKQEVTQLLNGDYAASVTTYNQIQEQALQMAEHFSNGIAKQFPARFA